MDCDREHSDVFTTDIVLRVFVPCQDIEEDKNPVTETETLK